MLRGIGRNGALLLVEAGAAGFYLAITRGLAPVLLAARGLSVRDVLVVVFTSYLVALGLGSLAYRYAEAIASGRVRLRLILCHGLERLLWLMVAVAAVTAPGLLLPVYVAAVASTISTSILMGALVFGLFPPSTARRVIGYRSAFMQASNVVGLLVSVVALAASKGLAKYLYLYMFAVAVGYVSTMAVAGVGQETVHAIGRRGAGGGEEERVRATIVFLYLLFFLAAAAVMSTAWQPYLIRVLGAPDYLAASLGLVETLAGMVASLLWLRLPYRAYRLAVAGLASSPLLVMAVRRPLLHLGIGVLYAASLNGVNLLAAGVYSELAEKMGVVRSSAMLVNAASAAQVVGLGTAIALLAAGAPVQAVFIPSTLYASLASLVAFIAMPEVSVIKPQHAAIYARQLYNITLIGYGVLTTLVGRYVRLAAQLAALATSFIILYLIYRTIYYLILLTGGGPP